MEIKQKYESILIEMKSRFISYLIPISSIEDFKSNLESLKKEHKKAKHFVYAFKIDSISKSNDDGEPHGTGGRPLLELINKKDLNQCAIIVVRYFGGSKLGASKLLRTYLQSGINVVKKMEDEINVRM